MRHPNKVVITGLGVISSYGFTVDDFWRGIRNGNSAVKSWRPAGVADFPVKYAAMVDYDRFKQQFAQCTAMAKNLERRALFGIMASKLALKDSKLANGACTGVAVGSGVPGVSDEDLSVMVGKDDSESIQNLFQNREMRRQSGVCFGNDSMAAEIARHVGADGPVLNINGACAGAAQAIGLAFQCIRRGEIDKILAGGADSVLNLRTMSGLFLLGATSISTQYGNALCRPFDKGRSGLVAGEGGAMLVLESEASAKSRGVRIYGEITGYGTSLDAYKVSAPHPEGAGAARAMANALNDADMQPESIDYINAHGTSTALNDVMETTAIRSIFEQTAKGIPKVSSIKSCIGHWIAAAGAPEAIATLLAIKNNEIPPTINLEDVDVKCVLDHVANRFLKQPIEFALSNSFGFGGINACLIFGRYAG